MKQRVETYIKQCYNCQKNKHATYVKYENIQYQNLSKTLWNEITMNFIIKLSKSKNSTTKITYDFILIIIDKYIKYSHFISFNETFIAKQLKFIVFDRLIRYHEISWKIINDRNKFFTFNFWKTLILLLITKLKMFIVYHFQTNN